MGSKYLGHGGVTLVDEGLGGVALQLRKLRLRRPYPQGGRQASPQPFHGLKKTGDKRGGRV